jgi:hypothetical protein
MRTTIIVLALAAFASGARAQAPAPAQSAPLAVDWSRAVEDVTTCERASANAPHDWGCDVGLLAPNSQLAYVRLGCDCRPTRAGRTPRDTAPRMSQSIMVADPANPRARYAYRFTAGSAPATTLPFSRHEDGVMGYGITMTDSAANRRSVVALMRALAQAPQLVIEWTETGNGRAARERRVLALDGGAPVFQRLIAVCTRAETCH